MTNDAGKSDLRAIDRLVCTLADIQNMGYEVILVSSGAIAVGRNKLNMHEKPDSMRMKQAAAAVGQCSLMYLYDKFFGDYDKTVAQILLNAEDIEQEEKKENLTNTFDALLEMGIIPIVNENDSVSYKEIESEDRLFGDNDMLSSVVSVLCRAKRLVIFSDIDGFYDSDPRLHPNAKLIKEIRQIDESVYSLAGGAGSRRGTGGMRTKLQAAELAASQGIDTIVTNGKHPEALYDNRRELYLSEIRTACNKDIYDIYTEKAVSRIQVFIFSKPLSENCFFLFLSYLLQLCLFYKAL